jgi:hypothetical protein
MRIPLMKTCLPYVVGSERGCFIAFVVSYDFINRKEIKKKISIMFLKII